MPIDPLTVVVATWISKEAVEKILGPTAAYLGDQVKGLVEKSNVNIARIFGKAKERLGDRINEPGQVHPRVLRGIVSEGAFVEDELATAYFGGILAASRAEDVGDDRGVSFLGLVQNLSIYQIRMHYLFYRSLRERFMGSNLHIGLPEDRKHLCLFVPMEVFQKEMQLSDAQLPAIIDHTVVGLGRLDLIGREYAFGKHLYVKGRWPNAPGPGVIAHPTPFGAELYLWAHGHRDVSPGRFFEKSLILGEDVEPFPSQEIVAVPAPESPLENRGEIQGIHTRVLSHAQRMDERFTEQGKLPPFPAELRESIYSLIEYLHSARPVSASLIRSALDECINPSGESESSAKDRISEVKTLASHVAELLNPQRPTTT